MTVHITEIDNNPNLKQNSGWLGRIFSSSSAQDWIRTQFISRDNGYLLKKFLLITAKVPEEEPPPMDGRPLDHLAYRLSSGEPNIIGSTKSYRAIISLKEYVFPSISSFITYSPEGCV
jgi:hypothetical protein